MDHKAAVNPKAGISLLLNKNPTIRSSNGTSILNSEPLKTNKRPIQPKKSFNILIGLTGSVATIKLIDLVENIRLSFPTKVRLNDIDYICNFKIKVVMTDNAKHFMKKERISNHSKELNIEAILDDADEWSSWKEIGDPVLHIELRKWADLFVIAPLDANTMAKMSNGICDNLLTCVVRAWDIRKPLLFCPAMNCHMYEHPLTKLQLAKLDSFGYVCIDPVEKRLACGDVGIGGMSSVETITKNIIDFLTNTHPINQKGDEFSGLVKNNLGLCNGLTSRSAKHNDDRTPTDIICSNHSSPSKKNLSPNIDLIVNISELSMKFNSEAKSKDFPVNSLIKPTGTLSTNPNSLILNLNNDGKKLPTTKTRTKQGSLSPKAVKTYSRADRLDPTDILPDIDIHNLDPSLLLEQSMKDKGPIYETVSPSMNDSKIYHETVKSHPNNNNVPATNSQLFTDEHLKRLFKSDINSSVLNLNKFLTLCNNKEKSCFTCIICKHDYKNRKSMSRHFKEQHAQGPIYRCKPCNVSYKRKDNLAKHNKEMHPNDNTLADETALDLSIQIPLPSELDL